MLDSHTYIWLSDLYKHRLRRIVVQRYVAVLMMLKWLLSRKPPKLDIKENKRPIETQSPVASLRCNASTHGDMKRIKEERKRKC